MKIKVKRFYDNELGNVALIFDSRGAKYRLGKDSDIGTNILKVIWDCGIHIKYSKVCRNPSNVFRVIDTYDDFEREYVELGVSEVRDFMSNRGVSFSIEEV